MFILRRITTYLQAILRPKNYIYHERNYAVITAVDCLSRLTDIPYPFQMTNLLSRSEVKYERKQQKLW